jgi:hypothetical protein
VVSFDLSASGERFRGTAFTLAAAGRPPTQNTDFVISSVTGAIDGSTLEIAFNGSAKTTTHLDNGSFTVQFPMPDGTNVPLTFHPTTVDAIATAQAAFRHRFS